MKKCSLSQSENNIGRKAFRLGDGSDTRTSLMSCELLSAMSMFTERDSPAGITVCDHLKAPSESMRTSKVESPNTRSTNTPYLGSEMRPLTATSFASSSPMFSIVSVSVTCTWSSLLDDDDEDEEDDDE